MTLLSLTVDGHVFAVRVRPEEPGVTNFEWLTGPPGYGFSSATSDGSALDGSQMEEVIRGFLAAVDPGTGHLD
jgi:hypothetical protein